MLDSPSIVFPFPGEVNVSRNHALSLLRAVRDTVEGNNEKKPRVDHLVCGGLDVLCRSYGIDQAEYGVHTRGRDLSYSRVEYD